MSMQEQFWELLSNRQLVEAKNCLNEASDQEQLEIMELLYQRSAFQRRPMMVSVLERTFDQSKNFADFYQAWLPSSQDQNPMQIAGDTYLQTFPVPVRVINGVDIKDDHRVISIGITWVRDEKEKQQLWEYIRQAENGEDQTNNRRHESINEVAEGKLIGLFQVESDDNLGTPF